MWCRRNHLRCKCALVFVSVKLVGQQRSPKGSFGSRLFELENAWHTIMWQMHPSFAHLSGGFEWFCIKKAAMVKGYMRQFAERLYLKMCRRISSLTTLQKLFSSVSIATLCGREKKWADEHGTNKRKCWSAQASQSRTAFPQNNWTKQQRQQCHYLLLLLSLSLTSTDYSFLITATLLLVAIGCWSVVHSHLGLVRPLRKLWLLWTMLSRWPWPCVCHYC